MRYGEARAHRTSLAAPIRRAICLKPFTGRVGTPCLIPQMHCVKSIDLAPNNDDLGKADTLEVKSKCRVKNADKFTRFYFFHVFY